MNKEKIEQLFKKLLSKLESRKQSQEKYILYFIVKLQKNYKSYLDFIDECITPIIQEYILTIQKQISFNNKIVPPKIQQISKIIEILYKQSWTSKQSYLILKQSIFQIRQKIDRPLTPKNLSKVNLHMQNPQLFNPRQNNRHIQGYDCLHQLTATNINESMKINKTFCQQDHILTESLVREVNSPNYFQPSIQIPAQLSGIYHEEKSTFDEQLL